MTVSTTGNRAAYVGNGVTTAFGFSFAFLATGDIKVYLDGSLQSTGYTVSAAPAASGTVTFSGAPANGVEVVIQRETTKTQQIDFVANDPFAADVTESGFDRGILIAQDNAAGVARSLRAPDYAAPVDAFDIAASAGMLLGVNDDGDGFEAFSPSTASTIATQAQAEAGTNNTTVMTPLTVRQGLKTAAFTPDVDTDGFYDGVSGAGFFADYNCLGGVAWRPDLSASQASISGGGIRDGFAVLARDTDTTDYTAIGRKISNGARILMTGAYDADTDTWGAQAGKDVIGLDVHAIANVTDPNRGVSGIAAGSINYGTGIISHEFSVENPAAGSQSLSMAAVQGIIRPYNAADDGSHVYQAFLATNTGHRVTAGLRLTSTPISGSYNGRFRYGVDMTPASIEECALRLRGTSAVGHAATVIEYDANDYSYYDRANDRYAFVVGGSARLFINSSGLNFSGFTGNAILEYDGNDYTFYDKTNNRLNTVIAGSTVASQNAVGLGLGGIIGVSGTFLSLPASTTALAHFRALDGVAPSSPVNGDVWFEGDTMKRRIGGVTKTLTFT